MNYHPKSEPTSPSSEQSPKGSRKLYRKPSGSGGGSGPEESSPEKGWLGVWTLRRGEVADQCPAALQLEKKGYRLKSHCAPFGTILQYQKGEDWRFVIPSKPKAILSWKEVLEILRSEWRLRRADQEPYYQKLMRDLNRLTT